jgi:hypothetical protein
MVYKILLLLLPLSAGAQTAQVKSYLQQIAANQALISSIQKGIDIARTGLQLISTAKDAEFKLHRFFFGALVTVSPAVRNDFRIKAIQRMATLVSGKSIPLNKKLLEETATNLEELQKLLAHGRYQLTDDERLVRIDTIYEDMLDKFIFYKQFE